MKASFADQRQLIALLGAATVAVVSYLFYRQIRKSLTKPTVSIITDIDISRKLPFIL